MYAFWCGVYSQIWVVGMESHQQMLMGSGFFDLLGGYFVLVEPVYILPDLNTIYFTTVDQSESHIIEYTHDMLCLYVILCGSWIQGSTISWGIIVFGGARILFVSNLNTMESTPMDESDSHILKYTHNIIYMYFIFYVCLFIYLSNKYMVTFYITWQR